MKKTVFSLLILLSSITCFSEELNKENWTVEWGQLEGNNLSLSNQLLLTSIPTYFSQNIQKEHKHYIDKNESLLVLRHIRDKNIDDLKDEKFKILKAKDKLIFLEKPDNKKKKEFDKRIQELNDEISKLNNIEISKLDFINDLVIDYQPKTPSFKALKDNQIRHYIHRENIDYFVSGTIEQEEDSLFLTLKLYSKYTDEIQIIWSGVGSNEEIMGYREEMLVELYKYLVSPDLYQIEINIEPEDGLIYINDSFRSLGYYKGFFLKNTELDITISKEGFNKLELSRIIDEDMKVNLKLLPVNTKSVNIKSVPSGASLYYGSLYIGKTPLDIPIYSYSQKLTLSYDGYMDQAILINGDSTSSEILLTKGIIDKEYNFIKEKKNFFISSAIFSFSLGIPLYLSAQNDNVLDDDQVDITDLIVNISIGNAVVWGINLFYRLYIYLKAAEMSVE
ncbi:MAG: PEGA domain-containing protein [Spirochaetaceae bacterium]